MQVTAPASISGTVFTDWPCVCCIREMPVASALSELDVILGISNQFKVLISIELYNNFDLTLFTPRGPPRPIACKYCYHQLNELLTTLRFFEN